MEGERGEDRDGIYGWGREGTHGGRQTDLID